MGSPEHSPCIAQGFFLLQTWYFISTVMEGALYLFLLLTLISSVTPDTANLQGRRRRSKQMRTARQGKRNLVLFNKIDSTEFRQDDERDSFFYLKYDSDQISPRNLKPYYNSKNSNLKFVDQSKQRTRETVHPAKLITIKNYNSITKPNLPVKTISSSALQFIDSGDRQTKRKGNLIVLKNANLSVVAKQERKDSPNLPNGRAPPAWKLSKKKKLNKKSQKKNQNSDFQLEKKKKPKKQGSKKSMSSNSLVKLKKTDADAAFHFSRTTKTTPVPTKPTVPSRSTVPRFVFREPPAFV